MNSLVMNWRVRNWRGLFGRMLPSRGTRIIAAAAILFFAPPAWPQNEGTQNPNSGNTLNASVVSGFLARYSRPQTAQAAPRSSQRPTRQRAARHRTVAHIAAPQTAAPQVAAPAPETAEISEPESSWPTAQDNHGVNGIVPVMIRTVREMVETEKDASVVQENELSDLDIAAKISAKQVSQLEEPFAGTDGRANADEAETRGSRIAAFAENFKAAGAVSWFEPFLLMLAGAIAALSARRVFA